MVKITNQQAIKITGLTVDMPEPKETVGYDYEYILEAINKRYKLGNRGKEYNLITKYVNTVFDSLKLDPLEQKGKDIIIKHSRIRKDWIKAVVQFKAKIEVKESKEGLIIKF
jgi:hypothetical protein